VAEADMVKDRCFQAVATHAMDFVVAIDAVDGNLFGSDSNYWTVYSMEMAKMLTARPDCSSVKERKACEMGIPWSR
jgi:hypothetical protein